MHLYSITYQHHCYREAWAEENGAEVPPPPHPTYNVYEVREAACIVMGEECSGWGDAAVGFSNSIA